MDKPGAKRDPNPEWAKPFVAAISRAFLPELLHPKFRNGGRASAGHCYAASEALHHALGGKAAGWKPMGVKCEGVSHWFLTGPGGQIVDPTWDQFEGMPSYGDGVGRGFLTKDPSKRARMMAEISGLAPGSLLGYPARAGAAAAPAAKEAGKAKRATGSRA